jgi:hypothetical protein
MLQAAMHQTVMHQPETQRPTPMRHIDCSAVEAISTWLDGDYHCGDEYALLVAIRRQAPTDLTDAEIKALVYEASEQGQGAAAVLTQLLAPHRTPPTHDHDARALRSHG